MDIRLNESPPGILALNGWIRAPVYRTWYTRSVGLLVASVQLALTAKDLLVTDRNGFGVGFRVSVIPLSNFLRIRHR
uniref:Uncharacterized protein n=1 Tax=Timema monikensis TaxID=170555 RepID=A0A7R9EAA2_9NEOP|nr:unnamed protein product [Timema monikensis]